MTTIPRVELTTAAGQQVQRIYSESLDIVGPGPGEISISRNILIPYPATPVHVRERFWAPTGGLFGLLPPSGHPGYIFASDLIPAMRKAGLPLSGGGSLAGKSGADLVSESPFWFLGFAEKGVAQNQSLYKLVGKTNQQQEAFNSMATYLALASAELYNPDPRAFWSKWINAVLSLQNYLTYLGQRGTTPVAVQEAKLDENTSLLNLLKDSAKDAPGLFGDVAGDVAARLAAAAAEAAGAAAAAGLNRFVKQLSIVGAVGAAVIVAIVLITK